MHTRSHRESWLSVVRAWWPVVLFFCTVATDVAADPREPVRARTRPSAAYEAPDPKPALPVEAVRSTELKLSGGSTLRMSTPDRWFQESAKIVAVLEQTHQEMTDRFGAIPPFASAVRLIEEEQFFISTGAPRWTNALFYRSEIMIPLKLNERVDIENLARSVRHEYTHAIIHALSNGQCPGWIDEGLAEWAEGSENTALRPALLEYLQSNPPVPFELLQGGFTRLNTDMVAAAYAQALLATTALIETFGFRKLRAFFDQLRGGRPHGAAFESAFGVSEAVFEGRFTKRLSTWALSFVELRKPTAPAVTDVSFQNSEETLRDLGMAQGVLP